MSEPLIGISWNSMSEKSNSDEDQKSLPRLEVFSNTITVGIFKDIQTLDEEQGGREIYSESNCHITSEIGPAADPGCDTTTPGR